MGQAASRALERVKVEGGGLTYAAAAASEEPGPEAGRACRVRLRGLPQQMDSALAYSKGYNQEPLQGTPNLRGYCPLQLCFG